MVKNREIFDRLIKSFDNISDLDYLDNPIDNAVRTFIDKLKSQLEKDGTEASGQLSASIRPLPILQGQGVLKIRIELEDYWKDINDGTKPKGFTKENRKKLQPEIMRWIANKPSLQQLAGSKEKQRSLSYAIATNILKKGTIKRFGYKGTGFVTNNLDKFKQDIIKQLEEAYSI